MNRRRLLGVLATVTIVGVVSVACHTSSKPGAAFTRGLTLLAAPGAKNEILAADFVTCVYRGLLPADRKVIAKADDRAASKKVSDAVTVRAIRRAARCDRATTNQLVVDSSAAVSESLGLSASQKNCVSDKAVTAISAADDRKLAGHDRAIQNGYYAGLAKCVSLRDFIEKSLADSTTGADPSCVADYAAKHLTWGQVLEGSNDKLQPVFNAGTILCINPRAG